jgi:hypothetical protein
MRKVWSLAVVCLALLSGARAQESFGLANSATGTTLNTLTKVVVNGGVPQAQIVATTDTSGAVGVTTLGNGTSGTAIVTRSGIAPIVFDNTTVAGDYCQISTTVAGNCHDVGATRPTSGQIIGVVIQTGGSAGTYNVLLDKSIIPSTSATITLCNTVGTTDTITAAGSFATTCSFGGLVAGSMLEVRAHGVYTTTGTASPLINMQVNAGGTAGICSHSANITLATSKTNNTWDVVCWIHIITTGAPGTASTYGFDESAQAGTGNVNQDYYSTQPSATLSYTTTTNQTLSIQETATLVAGQSYTLQGLTVRNITAQ